MSVNQNNANLSGQIFTTLALGHPLVSTYQQIMIFRADWIGNHLFLRFNNVI